MKTPQDLLHKLILHQRDHWGWLPLIDQDLREGRVLRLFDEDIRPTHGYYIQQGFSSQSNSEVQAVMEWLI